MSSDGNFNTFNYKEDRSGDDNLYKDEVDQLKEDKEKGVTPEPTSDVDIEYTVYGQQKLSWCPACDKRKPNTLVYFYPSKRSKTGISVKCRPCCDIASIKWAKKLR